MVVYDASRCYFSDACPSAKYVVTAKCTHALMDSNVNDISFTMDAGTRQLVEYRL